MSALKEIKSKNGRRQH